MLHLVDKHVLKRTEEQELAEKCRQGDNFARKTLYERYAGRMLSICLRYVGERAVAEDLLHDGFLLIFSSFNKFLWRGEGSLRAWMERIMVNEALQYLRRNASMSRIEVTEEIPDGDLELSDEDVDVLPMGVLMSFVSELPVGYRTVFNLYVFEEKSHREIASLLGVAEKSSASQLARAKALLATKINDWIKKHNK